MLVLGCPVAATLHAQTGRVQGTVTDAVTGAPIANAEVYLPALDRSATADAEGAFVLADVPVGTYEILVRAVGFQSKVLPDRKVRDGAVTIVDVQLSPWGVQAGAPERGTKPAAPHAPRFGVGLALAYDGLGRTEGAIGNTGALVAFGDYAATAELDLRAGIFLSRRRVELVEYPYSQFGLYLEPRYVVRTIAPTWAPFVAGQIGLVRESVGASAMSLRATGTTLAAGGGVRFQVWPQFDAELGALVGVSWFGSYTFRGERAWYQCLNALEPGTTLPESVLDCSGSHDVGAVLCYPPFYPADYRISGDCRPPDIPYDGTGRTGEWLRLWVGIHFSLAPQR